MVKRVVALFAASWVYAVTALQVAPRALPPSRDLRADAVWTVDHPHLVRGDNVMLQSSDNPNLCLDDGGSIKSASTPLSLNYCDLSNPNQLFRYDPGTFRFRSVNKQGLCIDDGGGLIANTASMTLKTCDPDECSRKFLYNMTSKALFNPARNNLCMDYGDGVLPLERPMVMNTCNGDLKSQQYNLVTSAPKYAVHPLLTGQQKIWIQSRLPPSNGVTKLCVESGFALTPCMTGRGTQIAIYDSFNLQIQFTVTTNTGPTKLCLASPDLTQLILFPCIDTSTKANRFVYDTLTNQFRVPYIKNLCVDGSLPSKLQLRQCDLKSLYQRFDPIAV